MPQRSTAEYYHEQTKYTPEGLSRSGKRLDFDQQPVPFKEYAGGERIELTRYLPPGDELRDDAELASWRASLPPREQALAEVSHLLYFTNGVTGMIPYPGQAFLMRAAPSAGGLYPTEIYLAAHGHAGLADGLYNYQVRDHSLVRFWSEDVWEALSDAAFRNPAFEACDLAVIVTGVFFRSAWRYEDRAYRRILLDTGHVLGNLAMYAPWVGRHVHPVGGFADDRLNDMLFLERGVEEAIALVPLLPLGKQDTGSTALPGPFTPYRELPEGQRLAALHEASKMSASVPGSEAAPTTLPGSDKYTLAFGEALHGQPIPWEGTLGPTILQRRSTRVYSGEGLTRQELADLLDFTYRPDLYAPDTLERHPRYFAPELLETFIAVRDVEGLDPGCYHYSPAKREVRQIRFTDLSEDVQYLALGQELAGLAGAVVFHTADLPRAVERYGDRAYRYLHLDAGHLGQRLNVAAIRLGLGVSGIGGFFDDQVNELLGIPEREAVLYITTIGRPTTENEE